MTAPLLAGSDNRPLVDAAEVPVVLLDLDGTVYVGGDAVPGAPATIAALRHRGVGVGMVTNNAARPPGEVVARLAAIGVPVTLDQVTTSAQAAAAVLPGLLGPPVPGQDVPVLVVGGDGLRRAVIDAGFVPVDRSDPRPAAVVQGFAPDLAWPLLAEGAYALAAGVPWVAANLDLTVPTGRGLAPGAGAFVELLAATSGRQPDVVAGKPEPVLLKQAAARAGATTALVVGDRLDTDIAGAVAAGMPSLLVLTGVTDAATLLEAGPGERPDAVARDLSGVLERHPRVEVLPGTERQPVVELAGWRADVVDDRLRLRGSGEPLDALRAAAVAAWAARDAGTPVQTVEAAAVAQAALVDA